jgi:hypothetical protein
MSSMDVIATMVTPSVLLLGNAMLILSTTQRLRGHRLMRSRPLSAWS